MENDTTLIIKPGQKRWKEKGEELNRYIGLLTLGVTIGVGIISTFIKALIYTYEMGRFSYWGIHTTYISVLQGNRLYDLFFYIAVTILFCGVNLIPYKILTADMGDTKKLGYTVLVILGTACFLFVYLVLNTCHGLGPDSFFELLSDKRLLVFLAGSSIFLSGFILGVGLIFGTMQQIEKWSIQKKRKKKAAEKEKTEQDFPTKKNVVWVLVLLVAVYFAVCVLVVYLSGYVDSKNQKEYKLVGKGQVILCEDEDSFLVARCEEHEESGKRALYIDSKVQTEIEKRNITTVRTNYDEVWLMDLG